MKSNLILFFSIAITHASYYTDYTSEQSAICCAGVGQYICGENNLFIPIRSFSAKILSSSNYRYLSLKSMSFYGKSWEIGKYYGDQSGVQNKYIHRYVTPESSLSINFLESSIEIGIISKSFSKIGLVASMSSKIFSSTNTHEIRIPDSQISKSFFEINILHIYDDYWSYFILCGKASDFGLGISFHKDLNIDKNFFVSCSALTGIRFKENGFVISRIKDPGSFYKVSISNGTSLDLKASLSLSYEIRNGVYLGGLLNADIGHFFGTETIKEVKRLNEPHPSYKPHRSIGLNFSGSSSVFKSKTIIGSIFLKISDPESITGYSCNNIFNVSQIIQLGNIGIGVCGETFGNGCFLGASISSGGLITIFKSGLSLKVDCSYRRTYQDNPQNIASALTPIFNYYNNNGGARDLFYSNILYMTSEGELELNSSNDAVVEGKDQYAVNWGISNKIGIGKRFTLSFDNVITDYKILDEYIHSYVYAGIYCESFYNTVHFRGNGENIKSSDKSIWNFLVASHRRDLHFGGELLFVKDSEHIKSFLQISIGGSHNTGKGYSALVHNKYSSDSNYYNRSIYHIYSWKVSLETGLSVSINQIFKVGLRTSISLSERACELENPFDNSAITDLVWNPESLSVFKDPLGVHRIFEINLFIEAYV